MIAWDQKHIVDGNYQHEQKILCATEFTEDTEETHTLRIMSFLCELGACPREPESGAHGGKLMFTIICPP